MTNSIFIKMLQFLGSIDYKKQNVILKHIEEYLDWFKLSKKKYSIENYEHYILTLNELKSLIYTVTYFDFKGWIADQISMYYIMSDENEV